MNDGETIAVHVLSPDGLGELLAQSFHQLTWFKAMQWLSADRPPQQ